MENKPKRVSLVNDIENRLTKWFDTLTESNIKTFVATSVVVIILLTVLSSLSVTMFQMPTFVEVIIGVPAGLLTAVIVYYFVEYKNQTITKYKEKVTPKERVKMILVSWAIIVPVLIFSSQYILAVGGVVVITAFIFTLIILRKTDEEYNYYINGIVDPRELVESETDEDYDDDEEEEK